MVWYETKKEVIDASGTCSNNNAGGGTEANVCPEVNIASGSSTDQSSSCTNNKAGGGTQVMSGWNMVKNIHFELHGKDGKAWYDEV